MSTNQSSVAVGTVGFDGARDRTFSKLDAVELQETYRGVPGPKLLSRLRAQAGERFSFVLQAPQVLSQPELAPRRSPPALPYLPKDVPWPTAPFDLGPASRAAWSWIQDVASHLSARAILLQTSPAFRPTALNRRRMALFFETLAAETSTRLLWDHQGLWSREEHQAICDDLDIVPVLDPLIEPVPMGRRAYLRVLGRARSTHGLSADELDMLDAARRRLSWGFVMLSTPRSFRDALALKRVTARSEL